MGIDIESLRKKLVDNKPVLDANIGGGCFEKALELHDKEKGGSLVWVGGLEAVDLDFGVHYMYFVSPESKESDPALNQSDNGYSQYPELTVAELKLIGIPQKIESVREIARLGRK